MEQNTVNNGVKLVGEIVLPGGALLLDGQIAPGVLHTIAGVAAVSLLGPVGLFVVKANSFSSSVTGLSLVGQASGGKKAAD
jgi:hypothetical protein